MSQDSIDINVYETVETVDIVVTPNVTEVNITSVAGSLPVTKTSELENDGEDGVNPFITLEDVPTPEFIQLTDTPNTYTGQGTKKVVVKVDETGLEFIEDAADVFIRRNANDGTTNYCGYAPEGSLETDEVWTITRIEVASDGSVTTATVTDVAWTDREIIIYT